MRLWHRLGRVLRDVLIWIATLVICFPLLWMVLTAFKPRAETTAYPPALLPAQPTLQNFRHLFVDTDFPRLLGNSLFVSFASTFIAVLFATGGAYALTRLRFPGRELIARIVLLTYLLPSVVLLIPLYIVVARLGLANSLWGLVLTYTTFALPFALWLLRNFVAALAPDVEAAASIDGAGPFAILFEIVVPQIAPGILATAVFTFIMAYNEYLYALVFLNNDAIMTLPPGVMRLAKQSYDIDWNMLMAASVVITVPVLLLFGIVQRTFGQGLGAGALKG